MQIPIEDRGGDTVPSPPFPGSAEEQRALFQALSRVCTCSGQPQESGRPACAAHAVLADVGALKRLVFYRRWHVSLRRAEWLKDPHWADPWMALDPGLP